jgi:Ca2+-binding EF-hand superfamily protein
MNSWVRKSTVKQQKTFEAIEKQTFLDQESIDDFVEMFRRYDTDKDGFLTYHELTHGMGMVLSEDEVQDLLTRHEIDREGPINLEQFVTIMAPDGTIVPPNVNLVY